MAKQKQEKNPRIKSKTVEVKSKAWFGKSQMEKTIEKFTNEGWELVSQQKVRNKDRYKLRFEYEMNDEEYKKYKRNNQIGCVTLLLFCGVISWFGRWQGQQDAKETAQAVAANNTQIAIVESQNSFATQTATLWTLTPTLTPSETFTPSITPTASDTPIPSDTPSITPTLTITPTPSVTPSPTITDTPQPTNTQAPRTTNTPRPATNMPSGTTYYAAEPANIRSCPQIDCSKVGSLSTNNAIQVTDTNIRGDEFRGSTTWYQLNYNGQVAYVHSKLVSSIKIVVVPQTQTNNTNTNNQSQPQAPQPTSPPAPVAPQWNCSGDIYNCDSFSSCQELYNYWNACPGDPSGLDGPVGPNSSGVPNVPCESKCGK